MLSPLHEATGRILVQDWRGHKPPPWGFFGGGMGAGETPLQAVLREVREELSFTLPPHELTGLDTVTGVYADVKLVLHSFLWSFDGLLSRFHQTEGAGIALVSVDEMLRRTEPDGPDHALTLALKEHLYDA